MRIALSDDKPEIFYCIQGEGRHAGRPSVFVRTSLCNLSCSWCDTPYTWDKKRFDVEAESVMILPQEVADEVLKHRCQNVVFTGGEPLVQNKELALVMEILCAQENDWWFEVETNGTLIPCPFFDRLISQYTVSLKLTNSGDPLRKRIISRAIRFFSESSKAVFKFVLCEPKDMYEVIHIVESYGINRDAVYLMSEARTAEKLDEKIHWMIDGCLAHGFRYTDRLHIRAFGDKRGT